LKGWIKTTSRAKEFLKTLQPQCMSAENYSDAKFARFRRDRSVTNVSSPFAVEKRSHSFGISSAINLLPKTTSSNARKSLQQTPRSFDLPESVVEQNLGVKLKMDKT